MMQERSKDLAAAEASLMKGAEVDPIFDGANRSWSFLPRPATMTDSEAAMKKAIEPIRRPASPRAVSFDFCEGYQRSSRRLYRRPERTLAITRTATECWRVYVRRGNLEKGVEEFASLHKEHGKETA